MENLRMCSLGPYGLRHDPKRIRHRVSDGGLHSENALRDRLSACCSDEMGGSIRRDSGCRVLPLLGWTHIHKLHVEICFAFFRMCPVFRLWRARPDRTGCRGSVDQSHPENGSDDKICLRNMPGREEAGKRFNEKIDRAQWKKRVILFTSFE